MEKISLFSFSKLLCEVGMSGAVAVNLQLLGCKAVGQSQYAEDGKAIK